MLLGLNLSHDASAALLSNDGMILAAVSEERLSRRKNEVTFPNLAIASIGSKFDLGQIDKVIVGSHSSFKFYSMNSLHWIFEKEQFPKFDGMLDKYAWPPGYHPEPQFDTRNDSNGSKREQWFRTRVQLELNKLGINAELLFRNHHDGHVFSAIGSSNFSRGLSFSLDAEGDGESGSVKEFWDDQGVIKVRSICRIPKTQSLGYMYSAVTNRYNFKPGVHEGKITGLAAYGDGGAALDFMLRKVVIQDGVPRFKFPATSYGRQIRIALHKLNLGKNLCASFENLADLAAEKTTNYPDLARATQDCLEMSVSQMVDFFAKKFDHSQIALAGGVFANVKLNQKLIELESIEDISIFPNMGDGGLAVGGVWDYLSSQGKLTSTPKFTNMYLDTYVSTSDEIDLIKSKYKNLNFEYCDSSSLAKKVAKLVSSGKIIGLFLGQMEFGPRALMNRSIIADPRDEDINHSLNNRLRRTEFMPFAPVCKSSEFPKLFDSSLTSHLTPFEYMTLTCRVKDKWVPLMPAVVHVDGTARPQIIPDGQNAFAEEILDNFLNLTGIPCLINTSFNIHEEPIVRTLEDAIRSLESGAVDYICTEFCLIKKNETLSI
jgi:carbamoyltransferase